MINTIGKIAIGFAAAGAVYAICLGALMTPPLQRFALYAHKFNTLFYHNLNDAERFGFNRNQVTPFNLETPDGQTLYAWHILPIDAYARNEKSLRKEERPSRAPVADFTMTQAFGLLIQDPQARVVISFHGNAGHIAQGWRTDTFRYLTTQPRTHVFTIDYRGFGHSTGSPTESGLIIDGVALVKWVMSVAKIKPERIVILGQSLGTAVASAVALEFADPSNLLHPDRRIGTEANEEQRGLLTTDVQVSRKTAFAGIVLVAPFSNLPSLMLTYRMGGIFPLLLPLKPFPAVARMLTSGMVDKWPTADRLRAYYDGFSSQPALLAGSDGRKMGSLEIVHGINDADIAYHQTEIIYERILGGEGKGIDVKDGSAVVEVRREGRPGLRFEIFRHGGHNRIVTYSPVSAAVIRAFEDLL